MMTDCAPPAPFVPPFKAYGSHITDSRNQIIADVSDENAEEGWAETVAKLLNGELRVTTNLETYRQSNNTECFIRTKEGVTILCMRGWGYLTGKGGLDMTPDDAADLQDKIADWVCDVLNGKTLPVVPQESCLTFVIRDSNTLYKEMVNKVKAPPVSREPFASPHKSQRERQKNRRERRRLKKEVNKRWVK